MMPFSLRTLRRVLNVVVVVLIVKVTVGIVLGYRNYFPANFNSDFLRGREDYYFGAYSGAFYAHIVAGPVVLMLGLLLISTRFRTRFPRWHRKLGRVQGMTVLLLIVPSGLWMAAYASSGPVAGVSLALLAILTGTTTLLGWKAAIRRQFAEHRRWMTRTFLLLCSAVVLRLFGGLGSVLAVQAEWYDPVATWISWGLPLLGFEISLWRTKPGRRPVLIPSENELTAVSATS
ncbi:DUF2306 domain-containing protein [Rubinisphaera margarita]|uniref:DUF2306 domain-containing protein n=1 Tax=Rubinisphaera margarita TaxID=2909586 RepID=UPI001EE9A428|nr:DUF2306 domain-containing protein [Rubinisphaera margarita]MCG6156562.1 DUF2306 domain-containing protein [Rubinisphaera margarita]